MIPIAFQGDKAAADKLAKELAKADKEHTYEVVEHPGGYFVMQSED